MAITYRKATIEDIELLIKLRLGYLTEDRGELSKDETQAVVTQLQDHFTRQINSNFIAYLAEDDGVAIANVYMAVVEKPANPAFVLYFVQGNKIAAYIAINLMCYFTNERCIIISKKEAIINAKHKAYIRFKKL